MIMHCMKRGLLIMLLMLSTGALASCVLKPPVQEMSDARTAIKTAQELPTGDSKAGGRADAALHSAENALGEATEAMDKEHYERARSKALEAKRHAQEAARIKQNDHH